MSPKVKKKIFFTLARIVLCAVLLVTTTFGLFTDTEETTLRVTSGRMEMDLLQADATGTYFSIKDGTGDVFGSAPWEPGQTRVVFFKVQNNSNIDVKYTLRFNVEIEEMSGVLEYCSFSSEYFNAMGMSWDEMTQKSAPIQLRDGLNVLSGIDYITMKPGESHSYAVAVRMKPTGGNTYQNKACTVDVNVYAVQGNADV